MRLKEIDGIDGIDGIEKGELIFDIKFELQPAD